MNTLNHINVTTRKHSSYTPLGARDCNGVTVNCERERWTLHVDATDGGSNRELTRIKILMHGDSSSRSWSGTIQDLAAIEVFARNAIAELKAHRETAAWEGPDDSIYELESLLSHFTHTPQS